MKELVFLLEGPSERALIEGIVSRISEATPVVRYIVFEGKQDLERQLLKKLKGYLNRDAVFIILRDQDSGNCLPIKERLEGICFQSGKRKAIVRIACRELES
jgi:hypothetical protein